MGGADALVAHYHRAVDQHTDPVTRVRVYTEAVDELITALARVRADRNQEIRRARDAGATAAAIAASAGVSDSYISRVTNTP